MPQHGTSVGELPAVGIEEVLSSAVVGRIGVHAAGRTYVVPVSYAYDGSAVYCHSVGGMKIDMLRSSPTGVCFEVDLVDDVANWRSVIAWGDYEELSGDSAESGLRVLVDRAASVVAGGLVPSRAAHMTAVGLAMEARAAATGLPAPIVFRIRLREKTGRYERAGEPV
jgi:nitroimidazol reductase NimA-like FMN-containing flavoprotein (pyridoxamine 5'-phosphate oxidase superfamily)